MTMTVQCILKMDLPCLVERRQLILKPKDHQRKKVDPSYGSYLPPFSVTSQAQFDLESNPFDSNPSSSLFGIKSPTELNRSAQGRKRGLQTKPVHPFCVDMGSPPCLYHLGNTVTSGLTFSVSQNNSMLSGLFDRRKLNGNSVSFSRKKNK